MPEKTRKFWVISISLLFAAINITLIAFDIYYLNALPFILIIALLTLFSVDNLLFLIVFLVPFSIPLRYIVPGLGIDFYLPTEPLLFGLLLIFIYKALLGQTIERKILWHPVSIAIYINLLWIFFTSATSTLPLVSFKYFLARCWFIVGFYLLTTQLFSKFSKTQKYIWMYIIPLVIVIFYDFANLAANGFFDQKVAHSAMVPFYNDHTSYGAILSMFIPVILYFAIKNKHRYTGHKTILWFLTTLFIFALIMSYSRAAWVSVLGGLVVWILIKLKIKFRTILFFLVVIVIYFASLFNQIVMELKKNDQDSSTDLAEHVQSIANIATDASNVERLNRWYCVFQMFKEKPILGWGPGTYQFQYAPFQFSYHRTIISTNMGDWGNAHSEYFGPLAESGVFGSLSFIAIIIIVITTAIRVYKEARSKKVKGLSLALLIGLITYFIHGTLNNFLDTDKASAVFWGFIAIIVTLDVYYKEKEDEQLVD